MRMNIEFPEELKKELEVITKTVQSIYSDGIGYSPSEAF
jgi:hypothetical protein